MQPDLAAYPARWRPVQAPPPLGTGAVHLCLLRLPAPPGWSRSAAGRRARHLGTRALDALLRHYGVPDPALCFGPHGKPAVHPSALASDSPLEFNYSHSGTWALFAFARQRALGVDLEIPPRRFINPERLAAARLTPAERRAWRAFPADQRDTALLACWTRKEAHGKVLGVGVRYPMHATDLFGDPGRWDWRTRASGAQIGGLQLALPGGALAALAYTGAPLDPDRLNTYRLDGDALLAQAA